MPGTPQPKKSKSRSKLFSEMYSYNPPSFAVRTWASVLADIPTEARCGLDLEDILGVRIDPDVFCAIPRECQRVLLVDTFGNEDDLVDSILALTSKDCVVESLGSKIMQFLIAPSKVTSEDKIKSVSGFIFDRLFPDLNDFREFCNAGYPPQVMYQPRNEYNLDQTLSTYYVHWAITHNITVDEDSGYLLLGDLVTKFAAILRKEFNVNFKYHPQRQVCKNRKPGRNPSTDCSIIHTLVAKQISEVLYEYKPIINSYLLRSEPSHLIELFLQVYVH